MKDIIKQLNLLISVGESNLAKVRQAVAILETLQTATQLPARRDTRYDLAMIADGWKIAEPNHKLTKYDHFFCNGTWLPINIASVGLINHSHCIATPDWNNPMNIQCPLGGYRFLLKGEKRPQECFYYDKDRSIKSAAPHGPLITRHTYICQDKHPLPSPNP